MLIALISLIITIQSTSKQIQSEIIKTQSTIIVNNIMPLYLKWSSFLYDTKKVNRMTIDEKFQFIKKVELAYDELFLVHLVYSNEQKLSNEMLSKKKGTLRTYVSKINTQEIEKIVRAEIKYCEKLINEKLKPIYETNNH